MFNCPDWNCGIVLVCILSHDCLTPFDLTFGSGAVPTGCFTLFIFLFHFFLKGDFVVFCNQIKLTLIINKLKLCLFQSLQQQFLMFVMIIGSLPPRRRTRISIQSLSRCSLVVSIGATLSWFTTFHFWIVPTWRVALTHFDLGEGTDIRLRPKIPYIKLPFLRIRLRW